MKLSLLQQVTEWENLLLAFHKAAKGKRSKAATATMEFKLADELLVLQSELESDTYLPGGYVHFHIQEPKRRKISAAPFRDRVVHHALCRVIEPFFERSFIRDSYANRVGKGTHRAVDRFQQFTDRYTYVLRGDIKQHFASIDHEFLLNLLVRRLPDDSLTPLIQKIITSGQGVLEEEYQMHWFDGDDLLAACRPRGLPIGNLTSQFWSNCYMDPFDHFVKRGLGCKAYLRYVDDFALFADSKAQLWRWKRNIIERLARLRLVIHDSACQVLPTRCGAPWLGFVIYPNYRRLKARKARYATHRLAGRYQDWKSGLISFAELDASVKGWINHACHADTLGLRKTVMQRMAQKRNQ